MSSVDIYSWRFCLTMTVLERIFSAHFFIVDLLRNSLVAWRVRIQLIRRECLQKYRFVFLSSIRVRVEIVDLWLLVLSVTRSWWLCAFQAMANHNSAINFLIFLWCLWWIHDWIAYTSHQVRAASRCWCWFNGCNVPSISCDLVNHERIESSEWFLGRFFNKSWPNKAGLKCPFVHAYVCRYVHTSLHPQKVSLISMKFDM